MTRSELTRYLRTLTSGTIASAIGSDKYVVIDRSITGAILYTIEQATEEETAPIEELDEVLAYLVAHRNYHSAAVG